MNEPLAKDEGPFARTRRDHALETAEDYLELIVELKASVGEARAADIAQTMQVSQPTVSKVLARLHREGLVELRPYRAVHPTEKGIALAFESKRRHELVLNFLISLGVPADDAAKDAEGIEHHAGNATLAAFRRFVEGC